MHTTYALSGPRWLLERAVEGLTGSAIRPLAECEGVRLFRDDAGTYRMEERRLS